ncbi:hypothetical protein [Dyadobacter sp. MSC1_007]|jgi:hypothetical protein|uniref:hypothetical protein n=1 Tax=Dyadobacter sp. MSC1_007 TaxID=2909264 RepID=UPI00202E5F86|nr:hypothetical protein [Dyadobacter sp. MSC1_007]
MSDQEPVGKRMLGQLREYTEPYQPDAWAHFEQFRANKKRKRRILVYWMSAAALLFIFGTAILIRQVMPTGKSTKNTIAHNELESRRPSGKGEPEKLVPSESANVERLATRQNQANNEKRIPTKPHSPTSSGNNSPINNQDYLPESKPQTADDNDIQGDLTMAFLAHQPFRFQIVHFKKLYIPVGQQQERQAPVEPARLIRLGFGLSQQSNQAADTKMELNYGVGGALSIPLTSKLAFTTGFYGSKQSLNLEKQAALSGASAEGLMQLQRARYHWVSLEAPLHVQYRVKTLKKLGINAVGGISLQSSVGQVSDYFYKTSRTITTLAETEGGPVIVSTQTVEDFSSVEDKDQKSKWAFGSSLYFGLGINYQVQNTGVELEPYIKYPIGAVTVEKLRLTSVGIQLRLTRPVKKPER